MDTRAHGKNTMCAFCVSDHSIPSFTLCFIAYCTTDFILGCSISRFSFGFLAYYIRWVFILGDSISRNVLIFIAHCLLGIAFWDAARFTLYLNADLKSKSLSTDKTWNFVHPLRLSLIC